MADHGRSEPGDKERVRDASDIVRVMGEHLAVKPKGREYVCLCPFHNDHNPSMRIVPSKQIYYCFVCGAGGDVFTFAMKFHKMEFREALEYLAERAGITLTPRRERVDGEATELGRKDLLDACESAAKFYEQILAHPEHGAPARAVVAARGISPEIAAAFRVGAAPDKWDGLVLTAARRGIPREALVGAGLAKPRDNGDGAFDMLRNRLVFPIHDKAGRIVAFGGRRLKEQDEPKYLNTPETRLFNKSATLYGLHAAARAIQADKTALITEGYMDTIACHQAGFRHAVATLGTALTAEHAAMLRPLCDTVILLFDGDDAGRRAADRAVPVFFAEPLDVRIATLGAHTDAKDPDELLKRDGGIEVFRRVLSRSMDLLEYRFARVRAGLAGAGVAAVSKAILAEVEALAEMGLRRVEPVRQRLIVRRLAELGGLDEATILRVLPAGRAERSAERESPMQTQDAPNLNSGMLGVEEYLLGCLLCDGALWGCFGEREKDLIAPGAMRIAALRPVAQSALELGEDGERPALGAVLARVDDPAAQAAAVGLTARIDRETESNEQRLRLLFRECVNRALLDKERESPVIEAKVSVAERLQRLREKHSGLPADRRILPRRQS